MRTETTYVRSGSSKAYFKNEVESLQMARREQENVWTLRQKCNGALVHKTLKSGLQVVIISEKIIEVIEKQKLDKYDEFQRKRKIQRLEDQNEDIVSEIWRFKDATKAEQQMLNFGGRYGTILYRRKDFNKAEEVLTEVLSRRKKKLGINHVDVTWTERWLGRALCAQKSPRKIQTAMNLFLAILEAKHDHYGATNTLTTSFATELVRAHCSKEDYDSVVRMCRPFVERTSNSKTPDAIRPCQQYKMHLADALCNQKGTKATKGLHEAEVLYNEVYLQSKGTGRNNEDTLTSGRRLAEILEDNEKLSRAADVMQEVFNARKESSKGNVAVHLDDARFLGYLLLAVGDSKAGEVLKLSWDALTQGEAGERKRAENGHYYGKWLYKDGQYVRAKQVLEEVLAVKDRYHSLDDEEYQKTLKLQEKVLATMNKSPAQKVRSFVGLSPPGPPKIVGPSTHTSSARSPSPASEVKWESRGGLSLGASNKMESRGRLSPGPGGDKRESRREASTGDDHRKSRSGAISPRPGSKQGHHRMVSSHSDDRRDYAWVK